VRAEHYTTSPGYLKVKCNVDTFLITFVSLSPSGDSVSRANRRRLVLNEFVREPLSCLIVLSRIVASALHEEREREREREREEKEKEIERER